MLTDAQLHRLLDIANTGCHKGLVTEARTIYEGILAARPGHIPARIGQGLSHLVVGEFEAAENILTSILEDSPEDADARAMLGLCYVLDERKNDAVSTLEPLCGQKGAAAALAANLLEQARS